ncbi:MAG: inositol monophosphatase, partial [Gammaproteobacteria bacterium]
MDNNIRSEVAQLVKKVATSILLPNFAKVSATDKEDGSWLTIADIQAHEMLCNELPKLANYPVLSEEMSEAEQQDILNSKSSSYWCIDPLDGTSNFTQGIPYWCTS